MPVHDWTRVDDGVFHAFHDSWLIHLSESLNGGVLPAGYYAMPEQHTARTIPDVLTLRVGPPAPATDLTGTQTATEAPPRVRYSQQADGLATRRRRLAIRSVRGHHVVAIIEIVSPANKDRRATVRQFARKAEEALAAGVHVLLIDLFPPGPHDPKGMHAAVWAALRAGSRPRTPPADAPLTLAAYEARPDTGAYLEFLAVGDELPQMPLFLAPNHYVNVPLAPSYDAAFRGLAGIWRDVVEGRTEP